MEVEERTAQMEKDPTTADIHEIIAKIAIDVSKGIDRFGELSEREKSLVSRVTTSAIFSFLRHAKEM